MQDGSNRQSLRGSIGESIGRGFKRARNFISPPPTGWRLVPDDGNEYRGYQRIEWHGLGERPRARSPIAEEQ